MTGLVFLVGAGPGDPGLITVKGLRCLEEAEVVVYDRLASPELLSHTKEGAELISAGKSPQGHILTQEETNALLVAKAREGKWVVRLKGGDPFVMGRGGEEAEALAAAGVPFQVVPGVTSAVAVPAYAGIPVTHRRLASSFAVVTGHEDPAKGQSAIAWDKIAQGVDTLVLLMAIGNLSQIVAELVRHGRPATTPVALIRWGTTSRQETVTGTLEDIALRATEENLAPPVVIVVGEVVQFRERLRWYDTSPLFGKRVLVTRSRKQASDLSRLLAACGVQVMELPTIDIQPLTDYRPLDSAIARLESYHWLVFTSVNGVAAFFQRLEAQGRDARWLKGLEVAAIGSATAASLQGHGVRPDLVPQEYRAQGLVASFGERGVKGKHILLPRAQEAPPELVIGLQGLGAQVDEVPAYRTVAPEDSRRRANELLASGKLDIVTLTSSSTVQNLMALVDGPQALEGVTVACIGPTTAATARALGLKVHVEAQEHTIPGLVKALMEKYGGGD
ncbi:MAG: uroporphyrinogen-III C-methyltransferase [Chloroflexi bacterium]|nr:uroporphyrinogen-III C-methyltransferase [Chloroflexota bacterium]